MDLRFLRDAQGRELDFVVIRNGKPEFAVECKTGEDNLSKNIAYFAKRTSIPRFYQVHIRDKDHEYADFNARVLPFATLSNILKI